MKKKAIDPKAEALLQAHLAYAIEQTQNFDVIRGEVAAFFEQLKEIPLSKLVPLETIQRVAKERVLELPLSNQLRTEVANIVKDSLKNPEGKKTLISDMIPDATADAVINLIAKDIKRRNDIIHEIYGNPTTGDVLSTTISHAIKDYMENNVVTKKIPGAAGLMKLGKGMLEKATDSNFDDALQNYLTRNIRNIMTISEKKTQETLNEKKIQSIGADLWKKYKSKTMFELGTLVDVPAIDAASHIGTVVWNHVRTSKFVQSLVADTAANWYARNSNRSLVELLADVNITPEFIVAELEPNLADDIKRLADNGYLKSRFEPILRQFYSSAEVKAIITAE